MGREVLAGWEGMVFGSAEGDVVVGCRHLEVIRADAPDLGLDNQIIRHGERHGIDADLGRW